MLELFRRMFIKVVVVLDAKVVFQFDDDFAFTMMRVTMMMMMIMMLFFFFFSRRRRFLVVVVVVVVVVSSSSSSIGLLDKVVHDNVFASKSFALFDDATQSIDSVLSCKNSLHKFPFFFLCRCVVV